jgi:hypothetical protein
MEEKSCDNCGHQGTGYCPSEIRYICWKPKAKIIKTLTCDDIETITEKIYNYYNNHDCHPEDISYHILEDGSSKITHGEK